MWSTTHEQWWKKYAIWLYASSLSGNKTITSLQLIFSEMKPVLIQGGNPHGVLTRCLILSPVNLRPLDRSDDNPNSPLGGVLAS